jgi:hypothetical protein
LPEARVSDYEPTVLSRRLSGDRVRVTHHAEVIQPVLAVPNRTKSGLTGTGPLGFAMMAMKARRSSVLLSGGRPRVLVTGVTGIPQERE